MYSRNVSCHKFTLHNALQSEGVLSIVSHSTRASVPHELHPSDGSVERYCHNVSSLCRLSRGTVAVFDDESYDNAVLTEK